MHLRRCGGDNRDHGKAFVFHHLADQLNDFHIDPMITDDLPPGPQRVAYIEGYRRFLRLSDHYQIVNGDLTYRGNTAVVRDGKTESYFQPHCGSEYDLFLDPDVGIADGGNEYVPYRVIPDLIQPGSKRVLMVYVSANRNDPSWLELFRQVAGWVEGRFQAFVCDLGGNGILFLANKENDRLKFMRGTLSNVFGPVAEYRVRK